MNQPQSTKSKARVAWGGDRYIISDGKSTDYYIQLQKEKVSRENRQKQFNPTIKITNTLKNNKTPESVLREIGNRNMTMNKVKKPFIQHETRKPQNQKSFHTNKSNSYQNKKQIVMPMIVKQPIQKNQRNQQNSHNYQQNKSNNQKLIKPTANLTKFR